ncbi:MAG: MerR family transcriptional regulator [Sporichthyaceae bacterium]
MRGGLTIGEFSQLTQLSVRTLRRYHEGGLLEPAEVDPQTGYRYYTGEQIPTAQVIHRLRELDMPLAQVRDVLATDDPDARADLLSVHLTRMEDQLERTRVAVRSLRRLLAPEPAPLRVELRSVPARRVAAIQSTVDSRDVVSWYSGAMAELDAALRDAADLGPPGGVYDNELFADGRGHALVYRQVREVPELGRVESVQLPAVELAVTTHAGDHDDIAVTYGALGTYVSAHRFAVAGPVRESYLVGPRDNPDPASWRTEIGWPVFRLGDSTEDSEG